MIHFSILGQHFNLQIIVDHVLLSSSIIDWNNPVIINKMYKIYLGDVPLKTKVCKGSDLSLLLNFSLIE